MAIDLCGPSVDFGDMKQRTRSEASDEAYRLTQTALAVKERARDALAALKRLRAAETSVGQRDRLNDLVRGASESLAAANRSFLASTKDFLEAAARECDAGTLSFSEPADRRGFRPYSDSSMPPVRRLGDADNYGEHHAFSRDECASANGGATSQPVA